MLLEERLVVSDGPDTGAGLDHGRAVGRRSCRGAALQYVSAGLILPISAEVKIPS
jgi:hypothetical protein